MSKTTPHSSPKIGTKVADSGEYVSRGDGNPTLIHVHQEGPVTKPTTSMSQFLSYDWKYRLHEEIYGNRHMDPWFVTLTFDDKHLPESPEDGHYQVDAWLRSLKRYVSTKTALLEQEAFENGKTSPDSHDRIETKMRYWFCWERGEQTNRLHLHGLVFFPTPFGGLSEWNNLPGNCNWRDTRGRWKVDRLNRKDHAAVSKTAWYLTKYLTKEQNIGRKLCSSRFGLTTVTQLLLTSHFQTLTIASLPMAQKLLQRLSLSPSYLTSKRLNSLIWRDRLLTISRHDLPTQLAARLTTGAKSSAQDVYNLLNASERRHVADLYQNSEGYRRIVRRLAKETARQIQNIASTCPESRIAATLIGSTTFGKSLSTCDPKAAGATAAYKKSYGTRKHSVSASTPDVRL